MVARTDERICTSLRYGVCMNRLSPSQLFLFDFKEKLERKGQTAKGVGEGEEWRKKRDPRKKSDRQ